LDSGKSYITDLSDLEIKEAQATGRFEVTSDTDRISECGVLVICVPTPLKNNKTPNYVYLFDALTSIAARLKKDQLIIVESTIVPTTSREKIIPILESEGFKAGSDFYYSFSPERIDPGNNTYNVGNIPKLVSGFSEECRNIAVAFYKELGIAVYEAPALEVAEMAKVLENTYRDVNIALVNQMARICHVYGINIWDVINAASSKPFGFSRFFPGPGVGGHCIPKDSTFYTYLARLQGMNATLAECARKINASTPAYIVSRLDDILSEKGKSIKGSKLLLLGVTYKKDVNDIRESPVFDMIDLLVSKGAKVSYHDPFIKHIKTHRTRLDSIDTQDISAENDCIILCVAHSCYNDLDYPKETLIFDLTDTVKNDDLDISLL
jgi:UDP-N-acetyl-D-glucosamine dehydrogenase